jgi:hypothetical protein
MIDGLGDRQHRVAGLGWCFAGGAKHRRNPQVARSLGLETAVDIATAASLFGRKYFFILLIFN